MQSFRQNGITITFMTAVALHSTNMIWRTSTGSYGHVLKPKWGFNSKVPLTNKVPNLKMSKKCLSFQLLNSFSLSIFWGDVTRQVDLIMVFSLSRFQIYEIKISQNCLLPTSWWFNTASLASPFASSASSAGTPRTSRKKSSKSFQVPWLAGNCAEW